MPFFVLLQYFRIFIDLSACRSYEDVDPLIEEEFKRLGLEGVDASGDGAHIGVGSQYQDFPQ